MKKEKEVIDNITKMSNNEFLGLINSLMSSKNIKDYEEFKMFLILLVSDSVDVHINLLLLNRMTYLNLICGPKN